MLSVTDLAENVATALEISQADAKSVVTAVFAEVRAALLDPTVGGVRTDIGQFILVERDAREARNPFEGTTIHVPAGYGVKFKFSSTVKAEVKAMKRGKSTKAKTAPVAAKAAPKAAAKTPAKVPAKAAAKAAPAAAPAKRGRPAAAKPAPAPVKAKATAKPVAKAAKAAPAPAKRGRPVAAKAKAKR